MNKPIVGNLISVHNRVGRRKSVQLMVSAEEFGGEFSVATNAVTLDGLSAQTPEEIVLFATTPNYVTAVIFGVDDSQGGTGVRPAASVELRTAEGPV